VPSHRADTPADAPTVLTTRPSTPPPLQRRRDLRTHGRTATSTTRPHAPSAGLAWLDAPEQPRAASATPHAGARTAAPLSRRELHRRAAPTPSAGPSTAVLERDAPSLSSFGALALDPLFVTGPGAGRTAEPSADIAPSPVGLLPEPRAPRTPPAGLGLPAVLDLPWPLDVARELPAVADPDAPASVASVASVAASPSVTGRSRRTAGRPSRSSRRGVNLPQAGIAGALGLATIAVPLTGAFAVAPPAKRVANAVSTAALAPLPPFPLATAPARTALDDVRLLPDEEPDASVPARLAAPRVLLVGRASRSNERAILPGCDGHVPDVTGVRNGELPASMLCTLWDPSRQLRSDAAVGIAKLNLAYQQHFGHPMCFNDAYRSLAQQYRVKAERGSFAARPGTSEHGWGLAVDLCDGVEQGSSSVSYQWMRANAPRYGWENPTWARPGGAGPYEPWHWEYLPGEKGQASAY
jgi:D-alanyl-D-alanine carboxypeptidase